MMVNFKNPTTNQVKQKQDFHGQYSFLAFGQLCLEETGSGLQLY